MVELFEITKENDSIQPKEQVVEGPPPKDTLTTIQRERNPHGYLKDYYAYAVEEISNDPIEFNDAMNLMDSLKCKEAIKDEIEYIEKNKVWELVSLPMDRKVVGCKWILNKKIQIGGSLINIKPE